MTNSPHIVRMVIDRHLHNIRQHGSPWSGLAYGPQGRYDSQARAPRVSCVQQRGHRQIRRNARKIGDSLYAPNRLVSSFGTLKEVTPVKVAICEVSARAGLRHTRCDSGHAGSGWILDQPQTERQTTRSSQKEHCRHAQPATARASCVSANPRNKAGVNTGPWSVVRSP
jgi:hypothetical protein